MKRICSLMVTLVLFVSGVSLISNARMFRLGLIPNGVIGSCDNCHIVAGGPRNDFGKAVEALISPGSLAPFWDAVLAAEDSDGDGFTNGEELQDPNGKWRSGQPDPGDPSKVTNPGDPNSKPEIASSIEEWMFY